MHHTTQKQKKIKDYFTRLSMKKRVLKLDKEEKLPFVSNWYICFFKKILKWSVSLSYYRAINSFQFIRENFFLKHSPKYVSHKAILIYNYWGRFHCKTKCIVCSCAITKTNQCLKYLFVITLRKMMSSHLCSCLEQATNLILQRN